MKTVSVFIPSQLYCAGLPLLMDKKIHEDRINVYTQPVILRWSTFVDGQEDT